VVDDNFPQPAIMRGLSSRPPEPFPTKTCLDDPTMTIPTLPLELIDMIAGVAESLIPTSHWSEDALRAMYTTCHAWARIVGGKSWKKVNALPARLPAFTQLLQGGSEVGQWVRMLNLAESPSYYQHDNREALSTVTTLLHLLPNLQELVLDALPFLDTHLRPDAYHGPLMLKEVSIWRYLLFPGDRISDLAAFLNIFTEIDKLAIHNGHHYGYKLTGDLFSYGSHRVEIQAAFDALGDQVVVRTRVRAIQVSSVEILELMRRSTCRHELQSISMRCGAGEHESFFSLCDLLYEARDNVLDLMFGIDSIDWARESPHLFRLWQESERKVSACTSLRSLEISVNTQGIQSSTSEWSRAVSFLRELSESTSQPACIRINVCGSAAKFLRHFHAAELKVASVLTQIPSLRSVDFNLSLSASSEMDPTERKTLIESVEADLRRALLDLGTLCTFNVK